MSKIWRVVFAMMSSRFKRVQPLSAEVLVTTIIISSCILTAVPAVAADQPKPLKENRDFIKEVMAGWNQDFGTTFTGIEVVEIQVTYAYWNSGAILLDAGALNDALEARARERLRFRLNELEITYIKVLDEGEYKTKEQVCHTLEIHPTLHLGHMNPAGGSEQVPVGAADLYVSRTVGDVGDPCAGEFHEWRVPASFRFFSPKNESVEELKQSMEQAIDAAIDDLLFSFAVSDKYAVSVVYGWSKGDR